MLSDQSWKRASPPALPSSSACQAQMDEERFGSGRVDKFKRSWVSFDSAERSLEGDSVNVADSMRGARARAAACEMTPPVGPVHRCTSHPASSAIEKRTRCTCLLIAQSDVGRPRRTRRMHTSDNKGRAGVSVSESGLRHTEERLQVAERAECRQHSRCRCAFASSVRITVILSTRSENGLRWCTRGDWV